MKIRHLIHPNPPSRHRFDEWSLALARRLPSIVGGQLLHVLTAEGGTDRPFAALRRFRLQIEKLRAHCLGAGRRARDPTLPDWHGITRTRLALRFCRAQPLFITVAEPFLARRAQAHVCAASSRR
jgi:hypothetical protein